MYDKQVDYGFKKEVIKHIKRSGRYDKRLDILEKEIDSKLQDFNNVRFRTLKKWDVQLELLYGLMWVRNMNTADLADELECSTRTVERYIFEGAFVPDEVKRKISNIFEVPISIIFYV